MFPQKAKKCSNQLVKSAGQECFKFEKDAENVPVQSAGRGLLVSTQLLRPNTVVLLL